MEREGEDMVSYHTWLVAETVDSMAEMLAVEMVAAMVVPMVVSRDVHWADYWACATVDEMAVTSVKSKDATMVL